MQFTFYTRFNSMARRDGLEATADYAAEHGFSAVEFLESAGPGEPSVVKNTAMAKEARKVLAARGLRTACWSVGTTVYKSPEAVASLKRQAEILSEMECPFLHHTLLLCCRPLKGCRPLKKGLPGRWKRLRRWRTMQNLWA